MITYNNVDVFAYAIAHIFCVYYLLLLRVNCVLETATFYAYVSQSVTQCDIYHAIHKTMDGIA